MGGEAEKLTKVRNPRDCRAGTHHWLWQRISTSTFSLESSRAIAVEDHSCHNVK